LDIKNNLYFINLHNQLKKATKEAPDYYRINQKLSKVVYKGNFFFCIKAFTTF
jgi:hypothetical protein